MTEALIKPANIQEQLLGKISKMSQKNLTEKLTAKQQVEDIKYLSHKITGIFINLAWKYFEISTVQMKELSNQELEVLFLIVSEQAKRTASRLTILYCCMPVLGWMVFLPIHFFLLIQLGSPTIMLISSTRKIRKMLGDSINIAKIIRDNL